MSSYTTPDKKGQTGEGQDIIWSADYRCPENAIILRRNVPIDVQNEDRFSPVNAFAFNPMSQNTFSFDNVVLAAILFYMGRKDSKALERIAVKYMDNVTDLLTTIVESGKAHPITALNASTAFAVVAHRFGMITDSGYLKIADQTRSIIDKLIQIDWAGIAMDGLQVLGEGAKNYAGYRTGIRGAEAKETVAALAALKDLKP